MHNIERFSNSITRLIMGRFSDSVTRLMMGLCVSFDVSPNDFFSSSTRVIELVEAIFKEAQVKEDRFINCIKAVRTCLGTGLLESKQIVEKFSTEGRLVLDINCLEAEVPKYISEFKSLTMGTANIFYDDFDYMLRSKCMKAKVRTVDLDNLKDYVVSSLMED